LIISCLALVGAWGGPAVAAKLITGNDVKDRSLTGRDLRSNTITGRNVANLSGRDIQRDSLDGTDVIEDLLATVPRARAATRAETADRATAADRAAVADSLTGARVTRVHFAKPAGGEGAILDLGGLRLRAQCNASGEMTVTATTTTGSAWIRTTGTMQRTQQDITPVLARDDDFRPGDEFNVLPAGADNVGGQIVYVAGDGSAVTVSFLAEHALAASRGYACLFAGTAVQAAA
jgi:hypothetical protein